MAQACAERRNASKRVRPPQKPKCQVPLRTLDRNGWAAIASGVLLLGVVIYFLFFIGDPAVKRFRDDCHRRELSEYVCAGIRSRCGHSAAVAKCERELRLDIDGNAGTLADRTGANVVIVDVPGGLMPIVGAAAGKGWHLPEATADGYPEG